MARVNVNILGISELKWTGMGEFNSDDHYIYYCRQESLKGNGGYRYYGYGNSGGIIVSVRRGTEAGLYLRDSCPQ